MTYRFPIFSIISVMKRHLEDLVLWQDRTPELYENAMAMLNLCEAAMVSFQDMTSMLVPSCGIVVPSLSQ